MTANAAVPLLVLFYDDRYNETRDRHTMPVYRSLDRENIPFLVGSPEGTISVGRPGDGPADRKLLHYRPGHKIRWLLQVLPTVRSELVLLLDTDILWLCSAAEVIEKRVKMLAQRELAAARTVILFGEKGMWPPYQEFRGVQLRYNETAGYPPATAREPFRFVNAGAALGRPRDVLAMLECMQARYEGFPDACPAGHGPDGELRYYSPNRSYVPPPLMVPSRLTKYHGMRLRGSNWGWEQGCFHMYYLEHVHAELTAACPPVVLDRAARCDGLPDSLPDDLPDGLTDGLLMIARARPRGKMARSPGRCGRYLAGALARRRRARAPWWAPARAAPVDGRAPVRAARQRPFQGLAQAVGRVVEWQWRCNPKVLAICWPGTRTFEAPRKSATSIIFCGVSSIFACLGWARLENRRRRLADYRCLFTGRRGARAP
jgi:hypothetical protein